MEDKTFLLLALARTQIEYEKYEFCKDIKCPEMEGKTYCDNDPRYCLFSAKRFHNWLQENNFKIIKDIL